MQIAQTVVMLLSLCLLLGCAAKAPDVPLVLPAQTHPFAEVDCTHAEAPVDASKLTYKNDKERLKALSHQATVYSYGKNGRESSVITQTPQVALKMAGGWLTGSDRGEWGGELMFVDGKGAAHKVVKDNIDEIYATKNGVIVVAGLSHMLTSRGNVYLVTEKGESVGVSLLFGLDAAPEDSWMTESGEVFINTSYGASIIRADGTLQRALCKKHEYSEFRDWD
ncbi:hypothetical protein [Pseudomonas sp. GV071]|uniref:hypothetical protein n=1 Tax=Pseudomonas sp. GV071 TaxID=2135754 RepID=UPI000D39633F|nr:hypothetical protein [Pseudomonas sp. GV071]PTQ69137.1 hypothetical protein C8K61_109156 [Pseudomonas sp. GV071]